jgi:hypothetical protein
MCNMRRATLFIFLVFTCGLLPLADAAACHRGRHRRECSSCEPCASHEVVAPAQATREVFLTAAVVSGKLYQTSGVDCLEEVVINVFQTSNGTTSNGTKIGAVTPNCTTGAFTVTFNASAPNAPLPANNIMIIEFQRLSGGTKTVVPVGGWTVSSPHRLNLVLVP